MVCHSLLQWTTFCQTSPPWPAHLGWPHRAWLSFIELDKAMVPVWLDWLVFCEYGFSVSALWCPLATPTILLGFLLPWTWGISSRLLQKSTATAPYLGRWISPHHHPPPKKNLWDAAKLVQRGKFTAIKSYIKKQEKHQINNLILHQKQLEKEE